MATYFVYFVARLFCQHIHLIMCTRGGHFCVLIKLGVGLDRSLIFLTKDDMVVMLDVGQFAPSFTFLQARRRIGQELGLCPSRMISWLCWSIFTQSGLCYYMLNASLDSWCSCHWGASLRFNYHRTDAKRSVKAPLEQYLHFPWMVPSRQDVSQLLH